MLDGFIIQNGLADDRVNFEDTPTSVGARWLHISNRPSDVSAPIIKNCIFKNNEANKGGGIYIAPKNNSTLTPRILNTKFEGNQGGAIWVEIGSFDSSFCHISLLNTKFSGHTQGAYKARANNRGTIKTTIINSEFTGNQLAISNGS